MPLNHLYTIIFPSYIEFIGTLIIAYHVLMAFVVLLLSPANRMQARIGVINGVLLGLSFKIAATLLKAIDLQTWQQIFILLSIFAIRVCVKSIFNWEKQRLKNQN